MLRYIDSKKMGRGMHGWLDSHFHFSFAEYYDPANMNFGVLRVINDDIVQPGEGFDTHPHRDMEIVTYVVEGSLTHRDSMGNTSTLTRGQIQYMSAGTGVYHSEYNFGETPARFLQIWIVPDKTGYTPAYGEQKLNFDDRIDKWLPIAASTGNRESAAPVKLHADINMFASYLNKGKELCFETKQGRQSYLVQIEGNSRVNSIGLSDRDALEITEENISIAAADTSHFLIIEMPKE